MDVCADAHMVCGCLVAPLPDGIRGRKEAVVYRSSFSKKASSLPLGLRDKSNDLAHVFTPITYNNHFICVGQLTANSKPRAGSSEGIKTRDGVGCCKAAFV